MARQALSYMQSEVCHAYEVSNDELINQEPYSGDAGMRRSISGVRLGVRLGMRV